MVAYVPITSTGSYVHTFKEQSDSLPSYLPSGRITRSQQDLEQQMLIAKKMTLELRELNSLLDANLDNDKIRKTGMQSGTQRHPIDLTQSLGTCLSDVIPKLVRFQKTISARSQQSKKSTCTGARRAQAKAAKPGKKQASKRTPKTRGPNFGTVTTSKNMSSSTSSEERSTSPTFSDGLIDTPCPLKPRDLEQCSLL